MDVDEAIKLIEEKTVYRCKNRSDKSGFFIAVNDPDGNVWEWSNRKILKLAEIVLTKPKTLC